MRSDQLVVTILPPRAASTFPYITYVVGFRARRITARLIANVNRNPAYPTPRLGYNYFACGEFMATDITNPLCSICHFLSESHLPRQTFSQLRQEGFRQLIDKIFVKRNLHQHGAGGHYGALAQRIILAFEAFVFLIRGF